MVWSATIGTSLLMVVRTSIPRTISPFTVFRGQAKCSSRVGFSMLKEEQKMSNIFFHTDITLVDGSTLQGGKWPSVPWYPDTPETGAALRDLSWFIKICQGLFPRVHAMQNFPYPSRLHLAHIKLQRTSDIVPLWGAYVEYPLPTERGTCAMATGISEKMGGPHIEDSPSPWTHTISPTLSHVCPFCNKSHISRDSLVNHIRFYCRMVLMCPICGGCGLNQWRTVKGHVKKCAQCCWQES